MLLTHQKWILFNSIQKESLNQYPTKHKTQLCSTSDTSPTICFSYCLKTAIFMENEWLLAALSLLMREHPWSNNSDCNLMKAFNNQEDITHCLIISLSKCLPKHPRLHVQRVLRRDKVWCAYLPFPWGLTICTSIPWTPTLSHQHLNSPSTDT